VSVTLPDLEEKEPLSIKTRRGEPHEREKQLVIPIPGVFFGIPKLKGRSREKKKK